MNRKINLIFCLVKLCILIQTNELLFFLFYIGIQRSVNIQIKCELCKHSFHPKCQLCSIDLESSSLLSYHRKCCKYFKNNFYCPSCFTTLNDYNMNIVTDFEGSVSCFKCDSCNRIFATHKQLLIHNRREHELRGHFERIDRCLSCPFCSVKFVNLMILQNHLRRCRSYKNQAFTCENCNCVLQGKDRIIRHIVNGSRQIGLGLVSRHIPLRKTSNFKKTKSAFKGILQAFELYPTQFL